MESPSYVFLSNYINHHQIPFCNAMYRLTEGRFTFVQTQPMEEERVQMGWNAMVEQPYLKRYDQDPEMCKKLVLEADILIFGGVDDESYIQERLALGKPIMRYCERMYKTGQWRAISPRGLWKKFQDHTRYRNAPVYVLCAGGYVADDFRIVHAYPDKMFVWGYFPEIKPQDVDNLLQSKGYQAGEEKIPYLLWTGRMIDWKHPELAVETAKYLRDKGIRFHLDMVGGGAMEQEIAERIREYGLEDLVSMPGFKKPEEVRTYMEQADIYLFTSDRKEGWGAVANEAMNSACALVADHMIGAAPYLVEHGRNGFLYRDGDKEMLFSLVEELIGSPEKRCELGRKAYETVVKVWNASNAAQKLTELGEKLLQDPDFGKKSEKPGRGEKLMPCMRAPVIREKRMFAYLTKKD